MDSTVQHRVTEDACRLDLFVAQKIPRLSRAKVQRLIDQGKVRVNGAAAKRSHLVDAGDTISVQVPTPTAPCLLPEPIDIPLIYEDEEIVVINKPPGMVVHPAQGHETGTVVNALLARFPHLNDEASDLRPGIVHRLDKDTSGLLVVALNQGALLELRRQFKERIVAKEYLVLVEGRVSPPRGIIEAPIGRNPRARKRMSVVARGGKEAHTEYQVITGVGDHTLLAVRPRTGRTHQIRVHLASIGHPVAGDTTYGRRKAIKAGFPRQFLHAWRISFLLPSSGKRVRFQADVPADLQAVLDRLGGATPS